MMSNPPLVLCAGLLLVICITDQLSSVTGHSLKSAAKSSEKNGGRRAESLLEEIMNEIRDERRQQKSVNDVRSTTHRNLSVRLHHSITEATDRFFASGLATRDNKLYSAYNRQATIAIYDTSTFSRQRDLDVTGLHCITDMASCPDCDVVFIADSCTNEIHVIDDVGQLRTRWNVDDMPFGLSVNSQSNVIVTFFWSTKLHEYTPSGELVREVTLPSELEYPRHAIQLDNDRYVFSHGAYDLHRVCIVNGNGAVVGQCYGGQSGSGVGQLYYPVHLALFGESLLVAATWNYRVLQLNASSFEYIGELINTRSEGCRPAILAMNEEDARLYVAGYSGNVNCPINVYNLITE